MSVDVGAWLLYFSKGGGEPLNMCPFGGREGGWLGKFRGATFFAASSLASPASSSLSAPKRFPARTPSLSLLTH